MKPQTRMFWRIIWDDVRPDPWWQYFACIGLIVATVVVVAIPLLWLGALLWLITDQPFQRSMAAGAGIGFFVLMGVGAYLSIMEWLKSKWLEARWKMRRGD